MRVSRQQRLGGIKSWEVQLKANEAEQFSLQGKQFRMTEMARAKARVPQLSLLKRHPEVSDERFKDL